MVVVGVKSGSSYGSGGVVIKSGSDYCSVGGKEW